MKITHLMEWCKIFERHQISFLNDVNSFNRILENHVDSQISFEEEGREMSSKKYVGRVGQNTFEFALKKKNTPNYHSAIVKGKRTDGLENEKIDFEISGIDEKFVKSFLLMYLMFGIVVLWPNFRIGDIFFLIIGFSTFSLILTLLGREYIKYIKIQMEEDFKIRF